MHLIIFTNQILNKIFIISITKPMHQATTGQMKYNNEQTNTCIHLRLIVRIQNLYWCSFIVMFLVFFLLDPCFAQGSIRSTLFHVEHFLGTTMTYHENSIVQAYYKFSGTTMIYHKNRCEIYYRKSTFIHRFI
jgi:hypothetical protein